MRPALHVVLIAFAFVLLIATPDRADAADARSLVQNSSLGAVKSLNSAQIASLRKAGFGTAEKLAKADPAALAKTLKVDTATASRIVKDAQATQTRLSRTYLAARSKFKVTRPAGLPTPEERAYADLIASANECSILVRKVCGETNQCASSPGCPIAKELLSRLNSGDSDVAGSCLIALEDPVVFNQCTQ